MIKVLNIGPHSSVKGGMNSVVKNYIQYDQWQNTDFHYIPSYLEKGKVRMVLFYLCALPKILKKIKKEGINIVHLHMAERGSYFRKAMILELCKKHNIKVIIHHHGAEFKQFYEKRSQSIKRIIRKTLSKADMNIVLSKRLVDEMKQINPDIRITYLYNAVPAYDKNPYNANGKSVLFLGRLGERKGIYDLLNAIARMDERLPKEVIFNLCGDGETQEVQRKCRQMGIEHRIGHIGWIEKEQKMEMMKTTMINVLPSYNEGLPMTILETMAFGIPNIATRIASIPEVVFPQENGFLITPGNVEALSDHVVQLAENSEMRQLMSDNAYRLIKEKFSLDNHMNALEVIYDEVMNNES